MQKKQKAHEVPPPPPSTDSWVVCITRKSNARTNNTHSSRAPLRPPPTPMPPLKQNSNSYNHVDMSMRWRGEGERGRINTTHEQQQHMHGPLGTHPRTYPPQSAHYTPHVLPTCIKKHSHTNTHRHTNAASMTWACRWFSWEKRLCGRITPRRRLTPCSGRKSLRR